MLKECVNRDWIIPLLTFPRLVYSVFMFPFIHRYSSTRRL